MYTAKRIVVIESECSSQKGLFSILQSSAQNEEWEREERRATLCLCMCMCDRKKNSKKRKRHTYIHTI